jgi:hypothetical protein
MRDRDAQPGNGGRWQASIAHQSSVVRMAEPEPITTARHARDPPAETLTGP